MPKVNVVKHLFSALDPAIQTHLMDIRKSSGLPPGGQSLEILAAGWMAKERAFIEQFQSLGMENVDECQDTACGFLALTYSGSLVAVGPSNGETRRAVYVSINRRRNVPVISESERAIVGGSIAVGGELIFSEGPVKRTSAIYKLAILSPKLTFEEQNQCLNEATLSLAQEFQTAENSETG